LHEEENEGRQDTSTAKTKACIVSKPVIKSELKTIRVPLDPRVPDKALVISQDLSQEEETELLSFLDKNSDVFTWKTTDLTEVSRNKIEHKLQVNPSTKPRKQKLHNMSDEKIRTAKVSWFMTMI
jgi:hypothetical protein